MIEPNKPDTSREHLANERTFLAWIRTSIGIMAFGFVVVKFALFVKQISMMLGEEHIVPSRGYSGIIGIVLVVMGTLTTILSYISYKRTEKQINEGNYAHSSIMITILTSFLILVSIILTAYLLYSL